jgi:hypothetical protein
MKDDRTIITTTLQSLGIPRHRQIASIGTPHITSACRSTQSPDEALDALNAVDGDGWAWFASLQASVLLGTGQPPPPRDAGPLECAERVSTDRKTSIAITTFSLGQWLITTTTAEPPAHDTSILITHRFLRRDAPGHLHHQVLWEPDQSGTLRPVASRFIGFNP